MPDAPRAAGGRAARDTATPLPAAVARARQLVLAHGWNATSYQLLNPGLALWFASGGDAVVGYADAGGRLVVAGPPVCPADRLTAVCAEFAAFARDRRRRVCYFAVGGRLTRALARDGRPAVAVPIGAQPVWDPDGWAASVASHASLRAQLNRARNKGVVVEEWARERAHDHPALRACLREWLGARGLPPMRFLVEPDTLHRILDRRVHVAVRDGAPVGFLIASPIPAREGWLVEQIVRGRQAPNGTSELLVDAAMRAAAAGGARLVSLGLAPLSRHGPPADAEPPLWLRGVFGWVHAHARRFYNFGGLDAFKAKLRPDDWEPIHAVADGARFAPADLYAIAAAFSGQSPVRFVSRALARAGAEELRRAARVVRQRRGAQTSSTSARS